MEFKDRLTILRKDLKLTQEELATKLGFSRTAISAWEIGRNQPPYEDVKKIANFFNVSVDYLLGADVPKDKRLLPVLGTVKAGYNYLAEENIIDYIEPHMNISNPDDYFGLVVKGDSMAPLFDEGDYVVVHKQDDFESRKVCIVLINGDEATIKKVIKTNDGIELHCFNPYYPSRKYTFKEMQDLKIKIIGVVEQQIRNWK